MDFKIWREGQLVGGVTLQKTSTGWEPLDDHKILKGDILENTEDGMRMEVLQHIPKSYIHPVLKTQAL